jgi:hypothetical protein
MRLWFVIAVLGVVGAGCHSTTAPSPITTWNYQASELSDASGQVTCTFGAAMNLSDTTGAFSGSYQNAYLACSTPGGASSTLTSGNINSGNISGTSVSFEFVNTDITNSGEISATTQTFTNTGSITANTMQGNATLHVTIDGQPYVLTGEWQATLL